MKNLFKKIFLLLFIISFSKVNATNEDDIYKKIDLFSEVLDKIKRRFIDKKASVEKAIS